MVDMQLYTVSPLILLFLLAWNKRRAVTTVCVLITVGTISTFAVNYWLELPPSLVTGE
jgi:predicted MFS family arabinose efflux permease